jgi:hypothetical protein
MMLAEEKDVEKVVERMVRRRALDVVMVVATSVEGKTIKSDRTGIVGRPIVTTAATIADYGVGRCMTTTARTFCMVLAFSLIFPVQILQRF